VDAAHGVPAGGFLTDDRGGLVPRVKSAARDLRRRHFWIEHIVQAWTRFTENNGNQYAAAITYFSFLVIFPVVLLGVSVAGFVLRNNMDLQDRLFRRVTESLPGGFGTTVQDSITQAIKQRTSVGIVGLVGVLLAGLGWIANLRAAINAVWGVRPPKRNMVKAKLADLLMLAGLGLGAVVSLALTVVGTSLTDQVLRAVDLDRVFGVHTLVKVLGIALAMAGDMLLFAWLLVRLPRASVPPRVVLRGALLAAVGFEILKIVGTYYISRVTRSPTAGIFGSVIGVLVWIDLVARYLLFSASWTATGVRVAPATSAPAVSLEKVSTIGGRRGASPLAVAASLVGAGAALGGGVVAWLTSRRRRSSR